MPSPRGLAFAVMVVVGRTAIAQPGPDAGDGGAAGDASALFTRARELKGSGHLAQACALFDRSYQLDPAPGTGLNLADCFEQQGQLRRAWALFDHIARDPEAGASRTLLANQRAEALAGKLATVVVTLPAPVPAGLVVRLDGQPLASVPPASELRAIVEPGDVELTATVPGRPAFHATLHAVAGAAVTAVVPAADQPSPPEDREAHPGRWYLTGGLGTAGVIGLGVSLGFGLEARHANREAFERGCERAAAGVVCTGAAGRRLIHLAGARADLATGFAIGGAVLVGAAATVFWLSRSTRVAPIATSHALGLGIAGRF
jgi:hypothetical protein